MGGGGDMCIKFNVLYVLWQGMQNRIYIVAIDYH